jgi:hypothetical protein
MYKQFFTLVCGNQRSWLRAIGPSRRPQPPSSAPSSVDLDAAGDRAISSGSGDARKTMKGLIATNDFLGLRFEELSAAVPKGYFNDLDTRLPMPALETAMRESTGSAAT